MHSTTERKRYPQASEAACSRQAAQISTLPDQFRRRQRRWIAVSMISSLILSSTAITGNAAGVATATSDPKSHYAGAPGTPGTLSAVTLTVTVTATALTTSTGTGTVTTVPATTPVTYTPSPSPSTATPTGTALATATRSAIAQPLSSSPTSPPSASVTAHTTATLPAPTVATAAIATGTPNAIAQPLAPSAGTRGAGSRTPMPSTTVVPTPDPAAKSLTVTPSTTATTGTATPTKPPPTLSPPRNLGLALIGPPILIPATADDIANGASDVIARVALRHLGEFTRPDGVPWSGWCEMFVGNVADEAGLFHTRFPSAITDSYAAPLFAGRAPMGSLVFFDQHSDVYGHVGIALGDGTMVSALGPGIIRTSYENWGSYVGWRPYPGLPTPAHAEAAHLATAIHTLIPEALSPAPTRGDEATADTAHIDIGGGDTTSADVTVDDTMVLLPPCPIP